MKHSMKALLLCGTFALACTVGCSKNDNKSSAPAPQPAAATQTAPAPAQTAPAPVAAAPAVDPMSKTDAQGRLTGENGKPVREDVMSEGSRVGIVNKFSFKIATDPRYQDGADFEGCKVWSGDLLTGGTTNGTIGAAPNSGSAVWSFTVAKGNKAIVKQLDKAESKQSPVRIYYSQVFNHNPCNARYDYYVTKVVPIETQADQAAQQGVPKPPAAPHP